MSDTPKMPLPPTSEGAPKLPSGRTLGKDKKPLSLQTAGIGKRFGQLDPKMKPKALAISAVLLCLIITLGWYFLIKRPLEQRRLAAEIELKAAQAAAHTAELNLKQKQLEVDSVRTAQARGTLTLKTNPPAATVTLDEGTVMNAPALFKSVKVGPHPLKIALEGYEVVNLDAVVKDNETTDLGTINLVRSQGGLTLSSPLSNVEFVLRDGEKVVAKGRLPEQGLAQIKTLPTGDYVLIAHRGDYEVRQEIVIVRNDTTAITIVFPFATVQIASTPPGATVRQGDKELGVTPLTLTEVRPGDFTYTLSLVGYKPGTVTGKAEIGKSQTVQLALEVSRDFTNTIGMEMIWIPGNGFWAGKYEVTQGEYEKVMGYRSGTFSGARRPVETVSWTDAMLFCSKLNELERRAGKLAPGLKYSLPSELQWETLAADASLDDSVTSSGDTDRNGTEVVGSKKPNKFGLFDTRGNVWEYTVTPFDAVGQRHAIRGGSWLTSKPGTLDLSYREGVLESYRDKTIGFRCVLVKE